MPGMAATIPAPAAPVALKEKTVTFAIANKAGSINQWTTGHESGHGSQRRLLRRSQESDANRRAAKADLFVSIHADAFHDAEIKGASVYTLSTSGASSEAARWLADNENSSDLVGVSLNDKEDVLASVLLDLSQTATQEGERQCRQSGVKKLRQYCRIA